jgi:hypothetical protein
MPAIDTRNREILDGAVYMVVGRGTEGGPASYRLSITGVTVGQSDPHWGDIGHVMANSGYTLGAIQVDLGQRGTMPVGAISNSQRLSSKTSAQIGGGIISCGYANERAVSTGASTITCS